MFFKKPIDCLVFLFFFFYVVVILATFADYGITIDEPLHNQYGKLVWSYYSSLTSDQSFLDSSASPWFGSLFDILTILANQISPFGEYETRHLINAIFGWFSVMGVYLLVAHVTDSKWFGLFAAVTLIFTPRFYGHSFNNPKDVPFATFYVFGILGMVKSIKYWNIEKTPKSLVIFLGLMIGGAASGRAGGLILVFYLILFYSVHFLIKYFLGEVKLKESLRSVYRNIVFPCLIAYGVMLIFWPYLHRDPIFHIFTAIKTLKKFVLTTNKVFFEGQWFSPDDLPWYYSIKFLIITTPLPILFGVFLFFLTLCLRPTDNQRSFKNYFIRIKKEFSVYLIVFSTFFPHIYALSIDMLTYDGVRHFLFILPMLAIVSAIGYRNAIQNFLRISSIRKVNFLRMQSACLLMVLLAFYQPIRWQFESHPYQYAYFNKLAGTPQKIKENYESDYWGTSLKDAALWLNQYFDSLPTEFDRKIIVSTNAVNMQVDYYLDKKYFVYEEKRNTADISVSLMRWHYYPSGNIIKTIGSGGIIFTRVVVKNNALWKVLEKFQESNQK